MTTLAFTTLSSELLSFFAIATMIGSALVHIGFAIAVLCDAPPRQALCHRHLWALATLFGGVFVATAYFIIHYGLPLNSPVLHPRSGESPEPNLH